MIYELRTYWAAPGKIEDLHNRFRNVTLNVFKRHQMAVTGFWTPSPVTEESGDLVYILAFADEAAMKAAWSAFQADPEWIAGTENDYVRIATELAGNRARLGMLSAGLMDELRAGPLLDHAGQARRFGEALRTCWAAAGHA